MAPRWTVIDLVLVVLGSVGGALAAGTVATLSGAPNDVVLLSSFGGQYVGTLGVLWLIGRSRGLGVDSLGFDVRPTDVIYLGLGVALQIAIALLFAPLQQLLLPDEGPSQEIAEIFIALQGTGARLAMVAIATLLAPLSEELMFRGLLLRALADRPRRLIMIVTAAVFATFHLLGVTSVGAGVLVFVQIFLVGWVLAQVTLRHGRLGPAIFVHSGFNLVAAIVLLLPPELLEELGQAGAQ